MKKALKKLDNKGFTLVELIIVIAIIAVLAAVLAPQYLKYVERSRVSADTQTLGEIQNAAKVAIADPANDITLAAKTTIKVTNGADVSSDPENPNLTAAIKANLSSTPQLKSQTYNNGATCTITYTEDTVTNGVVTGQGGVIFSDWTKIS